MITSVVCPEGLNQTMATVKGPLYPERETRFRMWWRGQDGMAYTVRAEGYPSEAEARAAAIELSRELGWTPPRVWEWRRWNEPVRSAA